MAIQRPNTERDQRPQIITFSQMGQDIKKHRFTMYKALAVAFILSVIYSLR